MGRPRRGRFISLAPYLEEEYQAAERVLMLYPSWRDVLTVLDDMICSRSDPCSERVSGGASLPRAQILAEYHESDREYSRIAQNIRIIDSALSRLSDADRALARILWVERRGVLGAARALEVSRDDIELRRVRLLAALIPDLQGIEDVLTREGIV